MGRKSRGQNSRGKRRGSGKEEEDSDFEVDDNHDGNFDDPQQQQQTSKNPPSSKDKHLDFAQRRELQRKEAAEKRRSKMKCYLCNQTGHVRRGKVYANGTGRFYNFLAGFQHPAITLNIGNYTH